MGSAVQIRPARGAKRRGIADWKRASGATDKGAQTLMDERLASERGLEGACRRSDSRSDIAAQGSDRRSERRDASDRKPNPPSPKSGSVPSGDDSAFSLPCGFEEREPDGGRRPQAKSAQTVKPFRIKTYVLAC